MVRLTLASALLAGLLFTPPAIAQDSSALASYFVGKQVVVKIDMPGSQKGVDLRFNKPSPMDWKDYSSRIKQFGVAIRKGDVSRITNIVVKKDMIEFQLDGGGFGTFGDDTKTTVDAQTVEKSDYEKDLERQIAQTDDEDKKRSLQRDLDRERARREKLEAQNKQAAAVASQMKAQAVAQNRMQGGSRFNLRWSGSIPAGQATPEAVMKALADYVNFGAVQASESGMAPPAGSPPAENTPPAEDASAASPTAQLKRGMTMDQVNSLLGSGKQLSESVGDGGLKTQVYEYLTSDRRVEITYVDGLLVRFNISSR
jgi:hypothetical protein